MQFLLGERMHQPNATARAIMRPEKNVHRFILSTTVLIKGNYHCKIRLSKIFLAPNTSTPVQAISAAEEHLAEEQFLLEDLILNKESL
jgi:hypothetical protein